jgi:hypothetical protein
MSKRKAVSVATEGSGACEKISDEARVCVFLMESVANCREEKSIA